MDGTKSPGELRKTAEVQSILEENLQIERRRVEGSERRIFLLSGILHCGECGRALTGQSSHGSQSVHRYYAHVEKRISNVSCSVKRLLNKKSRLNLL